VAQLASGRAAERDSAVARLTLLGPRVVEPLVASLAATSPSARLASLEVLERLRDPRSIPGLVALARDPSEAVALRAMELLSHHPEPRVARALAELLATGPAGRRRAAGLALARVHAGGAIEALDPLVGVLLDEDEGVDLRLALLDALASLDPPLPSRTLRPLLVRLVAGRDPVVAARAAALGRRRGGTSSRGEAREDLHLALEAARAPASVRALAKALEVVGSVASIPSLARALERLGPASHAAGDESEEAERQEARAAVHLALAALDSRIALFDLREAIEARPRAAMPALLEAAGRIGDASLVPALTRAASEEPALLEPCARAFAAIARRERLRRTSAALRAVQPPHRDALEAFWARARGARPLSRGCRG